MARRMAAGELQTTWFERHGSTPITEIPGRWPEEYKQRVERRIASIESNHNLNLIERPEYKRRWNTEPWAEQRERALREWLLDRLEDARNWPEVALTSAAKLADRVRGDADFMQVAEMYRGRPDFDLTKLVTELALNEAVPFLPIFRYKAAGLEKRAVWERTWELQRQEDASGAAIEIPVPPKYKSTDFQSATYWRLRGKLDVPKERFISYPRCERETDASPVIAWAGWDHLQQAQALAGYYEQMRQQEGWTAERLTPLLAGLAELLPWLRQWRNEIDPVFGTGMGDFFAEYVETEARKMGRTIASIKMWKP